MWIKHVNRIKQLADAVSNLDPSLFKSVKKPTDCPFGKWLATYKAENEELRKLIKEAEEYHNMLHESVGRVVSIIKNELPDEEKRRKTLEEYYSSVLRNKNNLVTVLESLTSLIDEAAALKEKSSRCQERTGCSNRSCHHSVKQNRKSHKDPSRRCLEELSGYC